MTQPFTPEQEARVREVVDAVLAERDAQLAAAIAQAIADISASAIAPRSVLVSEAGRLSGVCGSPAAEGRAADPASESGQ